MVESMGQTHTTTSPSEVDSGSFDWCMDTQTQTRCDVGKTSDVRRRTVKPAHLPHHQSVHFSWQDYSGSTSPSSSESNARTGVSLRRQLTERCNTVHHCTVKPAHLPHHQSVHFSWQDYSGSTSPSSSESNARTGVSLRVTVMSVLLYASVVRIVVWDECSQSLLVGKLCRIGMA